MNKNSLPLKQILPVLFIVFIDTMGLTIIVPILPFYILAFDASPSAVGVLIVSYALAQLLFAPILGRLSDRFGRKPVLVISQVGTFSSLLLLAFAWALPILFLARTLDGITGANLSTVQSAVSDMTKPQTRARGLGLVGAAYGMGFVVGPLLGGLALRLGDNNYGAPALLAAGFALLSIMLTTFLFRETLPPEKRGVTKRAHGNVQRFFAGLRAPQVRSIFLLLFAAQFVFAMFTSTFALFTLNRLGFNSVNNSFFFGLFGVILILIQGVFIGRLVQRFGEYRLIVLSFVLTFVGYGMAMFAPQQAVPWYSETAMIAELSQQGATLNQLSLLPSEAGSGIGALLFVVIGLLPGPIGYALQLPTLNTLLTKRVQSTEIGQALGISAASVGAGSVLGPLLGGWLFEHFAPWAPFAINAFLSLMLILMVILLRSSLISHIIPNPSMSTTTSV